jgi:hypothetical protein
MNDLDAFVRLAQALAPWGGQLVYVGGWAHRIHRLDARASAPAHQAVFTRDTDLAFAATEKIDGDIKAALEKDGFKEQLSGEFKPPVAHYILGEEDRGFYAEFLTPLSGSGRKRTGEQDATLTAAGITAQKIRHLDVLLVAMGRNTRSQERSFERTDGRSGRQPPVLHGAEVSDPSRPDT